MTHPTNGTQPRLIQRYHVLLTEFTVIAAPKPLGSRSVQLLRIHLHLVCEQKAAWAQHFLRQRGNAGNALSIDKATTPSYRRPRLQGANTSCNIGLQDHWHTRGSTFGNWKTICFLSSSAYIHIPSCVNNKGCAQILFHYAIFNILSLTPCDSSRQ